MGRNKALLELNGTPLIQHVYDRLDSLCDHTLLVTNSPELYRFLPCPSVPDHYIGEGSLAGIHAALQHAPTELVFIAACDMPFLSEAVIRHLYACADGYDIVVPASSQGIEPLHALYRRSCLPVITGLLEQGIKRIIELYDLLPTCRVPWHDIAALPGAERTFLNLNTPQEYQSLHQTPSNANTLT